MNNGNDNKNNNDNSQVKDVIERLHPQSNQHFA
jgi:hypothetical protein